MPSNPLVRPFLSPTLLHLFLTMSQKEKMSLRDRRLAQCSDIKISCRTTWLRTVTQDNDDVWAQDVAEDAVGKC